MTNIISGEPFTITHLSQIWNNLATDNIHLRENYNKAVNPIFYVVELGPALGLPCFILMFIGFKKYLKDTSKRVIPFHCTVFYLLILPILIHFLLICILDVPSPRHKLVLIPLLTIFSAYGLSTITLQSSETNKGIFKFVLSFIILYQIIYVCSTEYYFVNDTRKSAVQWIKNNIPPQERITAGLYVFMPSLQGNYERRNYYDAPYLILHESNYRRYVQSHIHPYRKFPPWESVFHGNKADYAVIQATFKNESAYKLLKRFNVVGWTPEMILYKHFWGTYVSFIGDVLIYQKLI